MELETKIDFKDLKKQKNINKKKFKKAVKKMDYDTIQECLTFVEKYDEMVETEKYDKYYKSMPPQTREIIRLRRDLAIVKSVDLSIYEIFEKRLSDSIKEHINKYTERKLIVMKKQLVNANKQVKTRQKVRTKAQPKRKTLV